MINPVQVPAPTVAPATSAAAADNNSDLPALLVRHMLSTAIRELSSDDMMRQLFEQLGRKFMPVLLIGVALIALILLICMLTLIVVVIIFVFMRQARSCTLPSI
jgi:hypothetical protein